MGKGVCVAVFAALFLSACSQKLSLKQPVGVRLSATSVSGLEIPEEVDGVVSLPYVSGNGKLATGCATSRETHLTVVSCACAAGACSASVRPEPGYQGTAGFHYSVSLDGVRSDEAPVSIEVIDVISAAGTLSLTGVPASDAAPVIGFSGVTLDLPAVAVEVCLSRDQDSDFQISESERCNEQAWVDVTSQVSPSGTVTSGWGSATLRSGSSGASFSLSRSCTLSTRYAVSARFQDSDGYWSTVTGSLFSFWDPVCLAPTVWFDASDAATVTIAAGKVTAWADKSGNSRHATQATSAYQPTYNLTGISGLPAVDFGVASDAHLTGPAGTFQTLAGVWAPGNNGSGFAYFMDVPANTDYAHRAMNDEYFVGTNSNDFTNNGSLWLNGAAFTGQTGGGVDHLFVGEAQSPKTDTFSISTTFMNRGASGPIGEVVGVAGTLSAADRAILEGYLAHKWKLGALLPAGHAYKTNLP